MSTSNDHVYPSLYRRLFGVWYRHMRVYFIKDIFLQEVIELPAGIPR